MTTQNDANQPNGHPSHHDYPLYGQETGTAAGPKRGNRKLVVTAAIAAIAGIAVGSMGTLAFTAGTDNSDKTSVASSSSDSSPSSGSPQTADPQPMPRLNQPAVADGATVTVTNVSEVTEDVIVAQNYRNQTETTTAAPGQKFVKVETQIENTGKRPWDLTCGGDVQVILQDPEDRVYNTSDELYRILGNPECNSSTQPGQTVPMTWTFEVPENVEPRYFGFKPIDFT